MRTIPSELVDEIIDRLASALLAGYPPAPWGLPHTDWIHTMGTLGFVCSEWYPRSRHHLFTAVQLRPGNIRSLFAIADRSNCDLLSFIQTLHLRFSTGASPPLLEESQLRRLGRSCRTLDAVWMWVGYSGTAWREIFRPYSFLESHAAILGSTAPLLSCLTVTFYDLPLPLSVVLKVASSLPALETLRLFGEELGLGDNPAISSFPRIRTFRSTILRSSLEGFFGALITLPRSPLLETISLEYMDGDLDSSIAKYFRRYGDAVQHLEVNDMSRLPSSGHGSSVTKLALQQTPNLLTLALKGDVTPLLDIMSAIASNKLTSIRVESTIYWSNQPPIPWSSIDALLSRERFTALRVFQVTALDNFEMSDLSTMDAAVDFTRLWEVRQAMPLAVARGILPAVEE
ncbi:hypothetical protein FB45DRAFT_927902 [Roridomyces roridus]|uniref:Uncharacterized protein n=1 Tax=Roridomyces roridus TaxID=1738132 RepID=A0AAD7FIZ0_9AGAR|nr:hypothetical protein FB45DRAFT_927902 [Roridomyces roridus]